MISEKYKFIFIHVPKTGGNSIQSYLLKYSDDHIRLSMHCQDGVDRFDIQNRKNPHLWKHSTLEEYAAVFGSVINEYLIFAVTRNPFEKVISHYFSPHSGRKKFIPAEFESFLPTVKPLEKYVGVNSKILHSSSLPGPDIYYLRFEFLQEDFSIALKKIGLKEASLIKRNVGPMRHHYRSYFNEATKNFVQKIHEFELSLGGYEF